MKYVEIKTNFEDFHCWENAPKEVEFLKNLHRHLFYVIVKIRVDENDREIEFFTLKKRVDEIIKNRIPKLPKNKSCEDIAEEILDFLETDFAGERIPFIEVRVYEDMENGAIINNEY